MLYAGSADETEEALIVRAAWLYYVAGLSQEEAARRLGLTRAKVNRLLAEARERGVVSISIEHRLAGMLGVEAMLAERFGLDFCLTTPPLGLNAFDGRSDELVEARGIIARRAVGVAAASFVKGKLAAMDAPTIGLGWGRTIEQMTLHLAGVRSPRARFVSLMGSLTRNSASNPFEVVHALAARTGGEGHFLPVPFIADSAQDREVLIGQRSVAEALSIAEAADLYIVSVGELAGTSLLGRQMLSAGELESLRTAGAVADTNGVFFALDGSVVEHELSRRTLAVPLASLRRHPLVLLAAGLEKVRAATSLLRSGAVNGLIIDGDTAKALAEQRA